MSVSSDRRQLDLRLLRRFLQTLHGHAILGEIDAVGLLELGRHPVDDALVEVVAAEVRVAVGRLHFDDALAHFEHGDVERAAAEVVDRDRLVLLLVETVGQRGGRRLVDDAKHVEARNLAGVFGRLPLRVVEVRGHRDDRVGHRLARGSPRRPASASAAPSPRLRAANISCRGPRPTRRRCPLDDVVRHALLLAGDFGELPAHEALD